ncbi:NAD(P)-dependent oxidoreductase [Kerstersia sp.]|uniref:NAD(P)-dependent oxidoreductase n=1 Tax=Kerstersia sp. TaxID=1930783 RepID=UPI003F8FFC5C
MKVTFIGLGAIGLPMALNIQAAGHLVTGVELSPAGRERAAAAGVTAVAGLAAAPAAEVVVVMVATPEQLAQVVDSVLPAAQTQYWVVMSTVGPDCVCEQAARLAALGVTVVDAPVTGGVARAETGELMIFAAGAEPAIAAVSPVLDAMGTVRPVGDRAGDGQAIKVVNQHLCSVHIVAAAEALSLAQSLGLDQRLVLDLVSRGAAGSWMLSDRGPRMLEGTDTRVTSAIGIFVKDSGLVAQAARECGAATPLLDAAHDRYLQAEKQGLAARDDSRVIETWQ